MQAATAAVTDGVSALKVAQKEAKAKVEQEQRFNTLRYNGYSREEAKAKVAEEVAAANAVRDARLSPEQKTDLKKKAEKAEAEKPKITLNMGAMFGGAGAGDGAAKGKKKTTTRKSGAKRMGAKRLA